MNNNLESLKESIPNLVKKTTYHKKNEKSTELITEGIGIECGSKTNKRVLGMEGFPP
jgi:Zn-dependent M32 family carboxypeptidase